jgi:hypothetical protein
MALKMKKTEKILFHYTTHEGLLGITESASIWGTNILYLNDFSEFNYAKNLLLKELKNLCESGPIFTKVNTADESVGFFLIEAIENNINRLLPSTHFNFFVCSFSEDCDLLSQWRGYGSNGCGYSIGFSLSNLADIVNRCNFFIKPCIYDKNKHIKEINGLLQKLTERFVVEIKSANDIGAAWDMKSKLLAADFFIDFIRLAPFLKHPKFAEEKEWRIMASLKGEDDGKLFKFRAGKTMILPYIEIPLPMTDERLLIDELYVGPTNEPKLSILSVELLLKSRNVRYRKINSSTIPFREV